MLVRGWSRSHQGRGSALAPPPRQSSSPTLPPLYNLQLQSCYTLPGGFCCKRWLKETFPPSSPFHLVVCLKRDLKHRGKMNCKEGLKAASPSPQGIRYLPRFVTKGLLLGHRPSWKKGQNSREREGLLFQRHVCHRLRGWPAALGSPKFSPSN